VVLGDGWTSECVTNGPMCFFTVARLIVEKTKTSVYVYDFDVTFSRLWSEPCHRAKCAKRSSIPSHLRLQVSAAKINIYPRVVVLSLTLCGGLR
jgi:hypothetical protein